MDNQAIFNIAKHFNIKGTPTFCEESHEGHINNTYCVTCTDGDNSARYILQCLNTSIFKNPYEVMENIVRVTAHIRNKLKATGGDWKRGTMNVIYSGENPFYVDGEDFWRMYDFVEGTVCLSTVDSAATFEKVGQAFGKFQSDLSDFDASLLHESIKNFHNTVSRFADFMRAVEEDKAGRAASVPDEIRFVTDREATCGYIVNAIAEGKLPLRVTHNDTKLNNILLDEKTGDGICVIDLDTVMPGSVLYDFGDSIRFGASSAAEDETDLDKVYMRLEMFDCYASGFLRGLNGSLTNQEILDMPKGALIITLETGIRFLTDYLNGDTYFKIAYPQHNLDRARNQFKLVADMELKMPLMDAIIKKYL